MQMKVLFACMVLVALCTGNLLPGLRLEEGRTLLAQRTRVPFGFEKHGAPSAASAVTFRVHLVRERTIAELEAELLAVSTPGSPRLGQHLAYDDVARLFAPRTGALSRVVAWLRAHDITQIRMDMDSLEVRAPAAAIERLFGTTLVTVRSVLDVEAGHDAAQTTFVGTLSIPTELAGDVELVSGIPEVIHFSTKPAHTQRAVDEAGKPLRAPAGANGKDTVIDPAFLRTFYGVNYTPTNTSTKQCIGSFGSFYNPQCLATFVQQVDGGNYGHINKSIGYNCWGVESDSACAQVQFEADLDVDYITSMSSGVETWVWQSEANQSDAKEWMLNWAKQVNAQSGPNLDYPQVFSLSYGLPELWQCNQLLAISRFCPSFGYDSAKYVAAVDAEFMKMGLRGWTVMVASGDDGAAADSSNVAYANNYAEGQVNQLALNLVSSELSLTCAVPAGGMGRGELCSIMQKTCNGVLGRYLSSNFAQNHGCTMEVTNIAGPSCTATLPSVSSNCSVAQLPTYTESFNGYQCEVAPYDYQKSYKAAGINDALLPNYPGSSPYITSVGATMLTCDGAPSCTGPNTEVVCSSETGALITSGGYVSPIHPLPAWQKSAVTSYFANTKGLPPSYVLTSTGRTSPDVAFIGHNFKIASYNAGSCAIQAGIDGTSASSPSFAGLVSLMNDARLNAGKGTLGFFNPRLYAMGSDKFNDITIGSNKCRQITRSLTYDPSCQTLPGWIGCAEWGFPAAPGYDAATGLGSPKFAAMLQYALAN